jgi:Tol biopolymer transport system component
MHVGPYEIIATVGAGGMGEVYRARDARLQRDVAIKVLPERVALEPDRLLRFEREARVLAALNHPAIALVHGLEDSNGVPALVMEFVDGETLADRLTRGPLAIGDALPIALQIADAVASAHERGIVHRDLKPANIKLRDDGSVKVLDFGIAKAVADAAKPLADAAVSPTITTPAALTADGVILGTIAYMAPEQARGAAVDKRADIWAFGCVVFEMLAGVRPFAGDSVMDTAAHVLKSEPDWLRLPAEVPASIRRLLRRALEKDPRHRLHDIVDARLEIADALAPRPDDIARGASVAQPRNRFWRYASLALAAVAVLGAIIASIGRRVPIVTRPLRVDIVTPATSDVASFSLSPDGASIAYIAATSGRRRLWLRSLETGVAKELTGTDGASLPFWAPNSKAIGFFADDGRLKRIDVDGGTVRALAAAPLPWGASWAVDDTILFAPLTGSIFRMPAAGGPAVALTKLATRQSNHSFPCALPDGRHFLYYVSGSPEVRGVYVATLDGGDARRLVDADGIAGAADGHVLFVRDTTLLAQPFDARRLEVTGAAFAVTDSVALQPAAGSLLAAVSAAPGRLAFRTGTGVAQRQFVWFDRTGREVEKIGTADDGNPLSPSLSPDGRFIAVHRSSGGNVDIWLIETSRGVRTRLTSHPANDIHPHWAPDGQSILFSSNRSGSYQLYSRSIGTGGDEKLLLGFQSPATDWSPDGRTVLIQRRDVTGTADIWAFPIAEAAKPYPVVQSADFEERNGQFSPDGKWIAYESTESGRWEIYIQPFSGPGAKVPVSINGGAQARWRADGRELFFIGLDERLMAAPVDTSSGAAPQVGVPVPLFRTRVGGAVQGTSRAQYFVSRDGQRILMNTVVESAPSAPITLIVNWNAGDRRGS